MLTRLRSALAGRFVIERLLGRGASAAVYTARDLKHGRRVALKVIEPEAVSALGARRFLQEIRTTARLNHPHILPLFDSGEAAGCIYYTMPVVEGESLRSRLDRDRSLPLDAVLDIARQVAGALYHAHSAGTIHRDIKPENILIDAHGHVWVADFGLASIRAGSADQRLTTTGAAVGSPIYMSPEQAAGESNVDGRSDIYSFACVLYEMIAGEPPFSAHSVPALLARHLSAPAPRIRDRCPDVPEHAEAALQRALAKDPAHRFDDPRELVAALAQATGQTAPTALAAGATRIASSRRDPDQLRSRTWRWAAGALVTAAAAVILIGDPLRLLVGRGVASTAESGRFVILPVERSAGTPALNEEELLHAAFARWRDVAVVGDGAVIGALERLGSRAPERDDYDRLGRDLRAGRFVRSSVAGFGDSVRIDATLFDRAGDPVATHTIRMVRAQTRPDLHIGRLADALLFPTVWQLERETPGTDWRAAQQAYLTGLASVREWDLARADSLFTAATETDPRFARAHAWRAQTMFWASGASAAMRRAAEQAIATADAGETRGRLLADALLAMDRGDYPAACARYTELLEADPRDYAATRGLADCHGLDRLVVADAASPTRWAFRSSGHRALLYHRRAFELLPASHHAYRHGGFLQLRQDIFYTGISAQRGGVNAAGERFMAQPWWDDTLVFHPVREADRRQAREPLSSSAVAAVSHLRGIFFDVTADWVAAYPRSPDALEAHAIAMELEGDTRALATLDRARSFAASDDHAINLSISQFWLMLKRAVPHSPADVRLARLLADSILEFRGPMALPTARRMAALAAVTGRGHRAAALARTSTEAGPLPLALAEAGAALLAYAAVGPYTDSLMVYETRVETAIRNLLRPEQMPQARGELLGRAAPLAMPEYRMRFMDAADGRDEYLIAAISAHESGDADSVRSIFQGVAGNRAVFRPADLKVEVLLPEAWLLLQLGDPAAALAWLAPTLSELRYVESAVLEDVASAGPLARAMLLRAEIAHRLGDATAAGRWAATVAELWTRADPELAPLKQRATTLARRNGD